MILGVFNQTYISLFFNNRLDNKKDGLHCDNIVYLWFFNIYRLVIALLATLKIESYIYMVVYIIINTLGASALLTNYLVGDGIRVFCNKSVRFFFLCNLIFITS